MLFIVTSELKVQQSQSKFRTRTSLVPADLAANSARRFAPLCDGDNANQATWLTFNMALYVQINILNSCKYDIASSYWARNVWYRRLKSSNHNDLKDFSGARTNYF